MHVEVLSEVMVVFIELRIFVDSGKVSSGGGFEMTFLMFLDFVLIGVVPSLHVLFESCVWVHKVIV